MIAVPSADEAMVHQIQVTLVYLLCTLVEQRLTSSAAVQRYVSPRSSGTRPRTREYNGTERAGRK